MGKPLVNLINKMYKTCNKERVRFAKMQSMVKVILFKKKSSITNIGYTNLNKLNSEIIYKALANEVFRFYISILLSAVGINPDFNHTCLVVFVSKQTDGPTDV